MSKKEVKELTKELLKRKKITGVADLQSVLKEMLKEGVETLLEAELDEEYVNEQSIQSLIDVIIESKELTKLKMMYENKLISKEEYEKSKTDVLKELDN